MSAQDTCYRLTTADNKRAVLDTDGNLVAVDPITTTEAQTFREYLVVMKQFYLEHGQLGGGNS